MEEEPSKSQADRIAALQEAIRNLERFNLSNKNSDVPNIQQLDIKEGELITVASSGLKKTIDLFASVFTKDPEMSRRRLKVEQKLFDSIAYLKTHWRVIDKLKDGDDEEQKIASWALETIHEYNTLIKKSDAESPNLVNKVFKTIYEHSGLAVGAGLSKNRIEPPKDMSVYFHTSQKKIRSDSSDSTMHKIASFLQMHGMLVCMPTTMEIDFFHMKSITLAKSSRLPETLSRYLMQWMRKIPIESVMTKNEEESAEGRSTSVIHLKQTLTPFPGEEITIEGKFRRDPLSSVPSIPIHESFHVTTKATQTGFPHPSQHDGWAMTKDLLAENPNRIDLIPQAHALIEEMSSISQELLPQGSLNEKAKHLLLLKKEAFADHLEEFLELHHFLNFSMIEASHYPFILEGIEIDASGTLDRFFEILSHHSTPYETLSRCYQQVNALFIEGPYEELKREWIDVANPSLWEGTPKERFQNASNIFRLHQENTCQLLIQELNKAENEMEKATIAWIIVIGGILGQAGRNILLQHLSEKIGYAPPLLNNFERIIQRCTYRHLLAFLKELNHAQTSEPKIGEVYATLLDHLQHEISLFQGEKEEAPHDESQKIVEELEIYYNSQHYRRDL